MSSKRHEGLRKFNRTVFNPMIKLIAGRVLYSLIFHVGRRSDKKYSTPVVAVKKDDTVFIPLPYGANTDWLLNVMARRECVVKLKGKCYKSGSPEIVEPAIALPAFSSSLQRTFKRARIEQFLRLEIL